MIKNGLEIVPRLVKKTGISIVWLKRLTSSEVEDKVDTGPLLHHLHRGTEDGETQVGTWVSKTTRETSSPRGEIASSRDELRLVLVVGDDLGEFLLDVVGVGWLTSHDRQGLGRSFGLTSLDVPSGGLGKEEKTCGEDDGPKELDCDGDSVRSGIVPVLGRVDDAVGEKDTDGDTELVTGHNCSSDLSGSNLGKVKDDDGRDESDTETGDQTTRDH